MSTARLSDKAYEHIKTKMLSGHLSTTEWLPIESIASELGSSRQPVMDAIKKLALEGFIEIVPQVGCRLSIPDRREIEDFYNLFATAEGLIAQLAAERASPSDKLSLKMISAQIGELVDNSGGQLAELGENYRVLNRQLHSDMRRICRSPSVTSIVESLGDRSDFYIAVGQRPVFAQNIEAAYAEHEEVVRAIAAGDGPGARRAMEQHIQNTRKRLFEQTTLWKE